MLKMAMMKTMMLPYLPWLTSSLLTPSITSCALGKRLLARTHLMSEAFPLLEHQMVWREGQI